MADYEEDVAYQQMGIKGCQLLFKKVFLLQVEPLHYVWKMEVQVTLHPFHIVSPCPCVPCSSSPLSFSMFSRCVLSTADVDLVKLGKVSMG